MLTAVLCGAGVAMIQALMPGLIKANFPASIAAVTGLYSAMIMGGGALGARLTPWLAGTEHNWRFALSVLAIPAVLALLTAIQFLKKRRLLVQNPASPESCSVAHEHGC